MQPRFTIGTQYVDPRAKHPKLCTIVDILTTRNSKDEVVKIEYVATHEAIPGSTVTDYHVLDITVAKGLAIV